MFSLISSLPTDRSSVEATPDWSLYVYQVADRAAQQRILHAIHRLRRPGVTALGTQRDAEHFVIIDYDTATDKFYAQGIVLSIDPHAVITFSGRKGQFGPVSR